MKVRKEITVALENKPGVLGHLCCCLAEKKVNILAVSVHESAGVGIVRLVVDKPSVVTKMLSQCCPVTVSTCDVLELRAANRPGMLAAVASKLGKRRINIDYVYGSASGGGKAAIILKPSNITNARRLLRGL
jgi:hypothetical protein